MRNFLLSVFLVTCLNTFCFGQDYWDNFQYLSNDRIKPHAHRLNKLGHQGGYDLYFCVTIFRGHYYPGKLFFKDNDKEQQHTCFISVDGQARDVTSASVALYTPEGSVQWVAAGGKIPENSIAIGSDPSLGIYTYLCGVNRANNNRIIGRMVPSRRTNNTCYYTHLWEERNSTEFDLLTVTPLGTKRVVRIVGFTPIIRP